MKNILAKFLDVILCIVIITFCLCLSLKPMAVNLVKDILTQGKSNSDVASIIQIVYPDATDDKISEVENKILNNKDVDNALYSYINYYTNVASGNDVSEDEVKEASSNLVDNNFDNIQNELGLNLSNDQKQTLKDLISSKSDKVIQNIKELAQEVSNNLSPLEKNVLKVCSFVTSKNTLKLLGVTACILAALIILLRLRRKNWLVDLSVTSIMSGIITGLIVPLVVKVVGNLALGQVTGSSINVKVNMFFIEGIVLFVFGILLMIFYKIVSRKNRKTINY